MTKNLLCTIPTICPRHLSGPWHTEHGFEATCGTVGEGVGSSGGGQGMAPRLPRLSSKTHSIRCQFRQHAMSGFFIQKSFEQLFVVTS